MARSPPPGTGFSTGAADEKIAKLIYDVNADAHYVPIEPLTAPGQLT